MKKFNFLSNLLQRVFAMSGMRAEAINYDGQPTVNRRSSMTSVQRHDNASGARVAREAIEAHRRVSGGQSRSKCAAQVRKANIELLKAEWLKYAAAIMLVLTIGVGNAWGTETTYTSRTSAGTNTKVIDTSNAWTASLGASYNASGAYWACNQGSRTITITCTGISDPITDIVVSGKRNKQFTYSISATVGGSTFGTTFTKSTTGDYTTNTLSNASGMSGTVVLTITSAGATSGGGSIWVRSITVTTKASCTLSSITLNTTSVQKTFCVGDAFNSTGLVTTAKYSGGCSDATVTPTSVSSPNMASAGEKTVTVSYTEGGVTKTATYTITVQAKYTVTWMVNGSSYSTGSPTTQVCPGSHVTALPTDPSPASYCGEVFAGWTDEEYSGDSAPTHLYKTASEFPNATGNQIFYAVFADYAD